MSGLAGGSSSPSVDSMWQTNAANIITQADTSTFAPQQAQQGTALMQQGEATYGQGGTLNAQGTDILNAGVAGTNATTGAAAPYFNTGSNLVSQGEQLIQPLQTGTLLPGEQSVLDTTLQAENATTQGTFANLNLANSTMDASALNLNQQQSEALQFQIAQNLATTGINLIGAGISQEGVGTTEQGIQENLANLGIAQEGAGAQEQQVGLGEEAAGQASQNTALQTYQNALQAYLAQEGLQLNTDSAYNTAASQLGGSIGTATASLVGGSLGSSVFNSLTGAAAGTAASTGAAVASSVPAVASTVGSSVAAGASASDIGLLGLGFLGL